jgi:phage baseplate assembly protein W
LSFEARPSGDVYIKKDAAAVKQAVKTLLLTNRFEKPFQPDFGADLNKLLFELNNESIENDIRERIFLSISAYEPRAIPLQIQATSIPDSNEVQVTLVFQIANTQETVTLIANVSRLR